ncbi:MAG: acetate/propionate family kinase [Planctomycetaceae bacterium]|nr:acetate/propionate family kinase [Planctomycetaceae bacterium]
MKVLVANLGSTSFKYRLFDMDTEQQLAQGGVERIGAPESACETRTGRGQTTSTLPVPNHSVAVQWCLDQLTHPETGCLKSVAEISAIGFKAVHGGLKSGVFLVDEALLQEMQRVAIVAPAHNPPYIRAMRQLAESCGPLPLVAAFETDFHRTIPRARKIYGIPKSWTEDLGVQRWGFHGASHRFIAGRIAQLMGRTDLKVISCHLGGSSSLCAIDHGQSVGTTMGMSPQTGLPQNNRVGDFDAFALPLLMEQTGKSLDEVLAVLSSQGGLLGISGVSGDMRDLRQAAASGNADAQLALDFFAAEVRRLMGGLVIELGPPDAIVFTGGIGQNDWQLRQDITRGLDWLGVRLSESLNPQVRTEGRVDDGHGCQIWVVPTNEELVVARQVKALLESR